MKAMSDWSIGMLVATQEGSDHVPVFYRLKWKYKNKGKTENRRLPEMQKGFSSAETESN